MEVFYANPLQVHEIFLPSNAHNTSLHNKKITNDTIQRLQQTMERNIAPTTTRPPQHQPRTTVYKYYFQPANANTITKNCMLDSSRRHFYDVFFDTPDYYLLKRGIWLRCRGNGTWSWKRTSTPPTQKSGESNDGGELQYDEVTGEKQIVNLLEKALRVTENSIKKPTDVCSRVIATFATTRITYRLGDCTLYVDSTQLGPDQFYVVGGFVPGPDLSSEDVRSLLDVIVEENHPPNGQPFAYKRASSKIVEYFRSRKAFLDASLWDILVGQLPALALKGPEYCDAKALPEEPPKPETGWWYRQLEDNFASKYCGDEELRPKFLSAEEAEERDKALRKENESKVDANGDPNFGYKTAYIDWEKETTGSSQPL